MNNIHFSNKKVFEKIKSKFVTEGKDKIHVLADFDRDYWMDSKESIKYGIVDGLASKF